MGFVSDDDKYRLLQGADVFMFPSLCEGFGIPILEAQSVGTPVITSSMGPLDEVAGDDRILVDPKDTKEIAQKTNRLIADEAFRSDVIQKGYENV